MKKLCVLRDFAVKNKNLNDAKGAKKNISTLFPTGNSLIIIKTGYFSNSDLQVL